MSLAERLSAEAKQLRERARLLRPSYQRDTMLRKTRQDEIASDLTKWLASPGLHHPIDGA
ncbi:MAG TPA: hypothetical protein VFW23_05320 [Tepidisphaeraceae bacterium]|nr:hypothetical protein [Tepidisphaeraceae bacterium]